MEPLSSSADAECPGRAIRTTQADPVCLLEHPFNGLSEVQAHVAYAESLSALEYLRSRYGMDDVLRILQRVGSGDPRKGPSGPSPGPTTRTWKKA